MENNYLGLLGLAKKAGMLEIGDEAARAAITAGKVRLVLLAADASERTKNTFGFIAESANLPCVVVGENRAELGNALGRRPSAAIAVCDIGFAAAIVKKLAPQNEEAASLLEEIDAKDKKISARRKRKKSKNK